MRCMPWMPMAPTVHVNRATTVKPRYRRVPTRVLAKSCIPDTPSIPQARDALDEPGHVEDQRDLPRPQDRRSTDALEVSEHPPERLDHRLCLAEQLVDDEPGAHVSEPHHHDVLAPRAA